MSWKKTYHDVEEEIEQICRERAKESGLSRAQLARRLETSSSQAIYLVEGKRGWSLRWMAKLCVALRMHPTELFAVKKGDALGLRQKFDRFVAQAELHEVEALDVILSTLLKKPRPKK